MLETEDFQCPYCGKMNEAVLDLSGGNQSYIEDCSVCCRPIQFELCTDGQAWRLDVTREDE